MRINWKLVVLAAVIGIVAFVWFVYSGIERVGRGLETIDFSAARDSRAVQGIQIEVKVISWLVRSGLISPRETDHSSVGSPNHLLLEVLETDSGVGGKNQFVFLCVFSDQEVEFHPKRSQDLHKAPVLHKKISQADIDTIQSLLAQDDVANLSKVFSSTFTPIDFNWTLDFRIPRETHTQQVKLVNFSLEMAKRNNKPYSEGLMKLACTVLMLRQDMQAETPDLRKDCQEFVPTK